MACSRHIETTVLVEDEWSDRLMTVGVDVRSRANVKEAVERTVERWNRIDVVVYLVSFGVICPCEDMTEHDLRAQFEINLFGLMHVVQTSLPYLRLRGRGHYIAFSSVAGILGVPGMGGFSATKWAIEGLFESLAYEIESAGVTVSIIYPGMPYSSSPPSLTEESDPEVDDASYLRLSPTAVGSDVPAGRMDLEFAGNRASVEEGGDGNGYGSSQQKQSGLVKQVRASGTPVASVASTEDGQTVPPWRHFVVKPRLGPYQDTPAEYGRRLILWLSANNSTKSDKVGRVVIELAHCRHPPMRLLLGSDAVETMRDRLRQVIEEVEDWKFLYTDP
ncbi:hypothetical protein V1511DRAFT_499999 [Dipodascopsis uninucleata]